MSTQPIGIFDSGVGGTSIWKEIYTLLPFENTLYLADSKNAPYGTQSEKKIIELSVKCGQDICMLMFDNSSEKIV